MRKKLSFRSSRRLFRFGANRVQSLNFAMPMRGGFRI